MPSYPGTNTLVPRYLYSRTLEGCWWRHTEFRPPCRAGINLSTSQSSLSSRDLRYLSRIFTPSYPGYSPPRTPDIYTLVPRIFIPSYPGYSYPRTPDIHPLVPRIFIPSYPGYSPPRTPDIHPLVPRIFIPWYLYVRTPDIYTHVPRIFIRIFIRIRTIFHTASVLLRILLPYSWRKHHG